MAFLFRPVSVKPIPPGAVRVQIRGKQYARWTIRGGGVVLAEITASGKCRVRSPVWWVEYRDSNGLRCRRAISRDRQAAQHRMSQIVQDEERKKGGLLPKSQTAAGETLLSLVATYENYLMDLGRTEKHARDTRHRLTMVITDCGWVRVQDVTPDRWVRWSGAARRGTDVLPGFSAETINHYLRSLRAFFRWICGQDPLTSIRLLNADADRRIKRRALSPEEFRRLIDTTRASLVRRVGMDGPARASLYLIAARTGLRSAVLAKLTPESLRLDDPTPHIPTEARSQKNRKEHRVPVPRAVVDELHDWLASRPPGEPLWPGFSRDCGHGAWMIRRDLQAAGIPLTTADGGYDFHALRKQCGTDLARAGVPLTTTQAYLGHSTPALTARLYIGVGLADLGAAADKLGSSGKTCGASSGKPRK